MFLQRSSLSGGTLSCLFITSLLATICPANQFDPHLYPKAGPFFEGWYVRIVDHAAGASIGLLFGRVLPSDETPVETKDTSHKFQKIPVAHQIEYRPLVLASVLMHSRTVSPKLQSYNEFFNVSEFSVTVKGKPVVKNPDDESPPCFSVQFANNGTFTVTGNSAYMDVSIGNVQLRVQGSGPVAWGPHGEGPEGWLEYLPLPLHWFVYSLQTQVSEYSFQDHGSGVIIKGKNAQMHMEKNWGKSFPPAWIWAQGLTSNNITLALSGGIVDFDVINVTAFLVGYRNPAKDIVLNFTPANSKFSFSHNECEGSVHLNVTSFLHSLVLDVSSPISSFSNCLPGPKKYGFQPVCVESYSAVAMITAYKRSGLHYLEIDHSEIHSAALEFGGQYVCRGMCPQL